MIFDIDPVKFNAIIKDLKMYDEDDDGYYDMEIEDDGGHTGELRRFH